MTEPSQPRPVPGPPRTDPADGGSHASAPAGGADPAGERGHPFADLDERPVAEHVAVYEAEHARLERELGTIDRL